MKLPEINPDSVLRLKNLGTKSVCWLQTVGIWTRQDLENAGAVGAWRKIAAHGFDPGLNLLYALEGALRNVHWCSLDDRVKENLRAQAASA